MPNTIVSLNRDRFRLPLNRSVVRFADAFIVHSRYVHDLVLSERNAPTPIGILNHGAEARWRDDDRRQARLALGLEPDWASSFLVVSFGGVQPHKRIDQALRALALARRQRADIRLILAGSMHSHEFDPVALARSLQLQDAVHFTGFLPEERAWNWLHAGDVALNLRGPTSGGTSGGIFQAFSMGRSVIASDAAEQRELPDGCVVKIPLGAGEIEALAREFVALRDAPQRRERLEEAVRKFVGEECHWRVVARQYAAYLASFPRPRAARRKLVALMARR
jgi:glycosyltransferase involved in cell wall biosynthesis